MKCWQADKHSKVHTTVHLEHQEILGLTLGEYLSPGALLSVAVSIALSFSLLGLTSAPSLLASSFTSADGPSSPSFTPSFSPAARPACSLSFIFSGVQGCFVPSAAKSTVQATDKVTVYLLARRRQSILKSRAHYSH